jgi:LytS/YehU family sensor histidine kinase
VTLRIAARRVAPDRLQLQVSNFGGTTPKSPRGRQFAESTGVGLVNVCQRLEARFGRDASCSWGPRPDGGYDVLLTVPVIDKDG